MFPVLPRSTALADDHGEHAVGLAAFHQKLEDLGHFYCQFANSNDLWNQFNKELDRLETDAFKANKWRNAQSGERTYNQQAEKIYNIGKIDKASFS